MVQYKVIDGKVGLPRGPLAPGQRRAPPNWARRGEIVELDPEFVKKFVNKFQLVQTPPESAATATEDTNPGDDDDPVKPTIQDLQEALKALPTQIASGEQKDANYVVGQMQSFYGTLFTAQHQNAVRTMFKTRPAAVSPAKPAI